MNQSTVKKDTGKADFDFFAVANSSQAMDERALATVSNQYATMKKSETFGRSSINAGTTVDESVPAKVRTFDEQAVSSKMSKQSSAKLQLLQ